MVLTIELSNPNQLKKLDLAGWDVKITTLSGAETTTLLGNKYAEFIDV